MDLSSRAVLNNGVEIPFVGLGVYRAAMGKETERAVQAALAAGYRHIDTAAIYGNEHSVGAAIRAGGIPREEVFVTTKMWRDVVGYDSGLRAMEQSLINLGLDYVDLYLIHWPTRHRRQDGWRAMERILELGQARAIGVSNYMDHHLEELFTYANVPPAVNQIELSPYSYRSRDAVLALCAANGIVIEAYSPLTKAWKLDDPSLAAVAARYRKSPAQILIRYILQKGMVVLPKSTNPARIRENAAVFDFEISRADMAALDALDENLITGWNPTDVP